MQIRIFGIDAEFNSGHRYIKVDTVEDLAQGSTAFEGVSPISSLNSDRKDRAAVGFNSPSTALFNLSDVQLEEVVEP